MSAQRYIVGVDGSPNSLHALEWTAQLATRTGADIIAVHAWEFPFAAMVPAPIGIAVPPADAIAEASEKALSESISDIKLHYPVQIDEYVAEGMPATVLLNVAKSEEADLLVVGTRGRSSVSQILFGSISRRVVTHAECPVVVLTSEAPLDRPDSVMVGFDGSPCGTAALRWALDLNVPNLDVVYAWQLPVGFAMEGTIMPVDDLEDSAEKHLASLLQKTCTPEELSRITSHVVAGDARSVLTQPDLEPGLTVIGERGHGGFTGAIIGSVTTYVALHSKSAVAVIPAAYRAD